MAGYTVKSATDYLRDNPDDQLTAIAMTLTAIAGSLRDISFLLKNERLQVAVIRDTATERTISAERMRFPK